MGRAGGRFTKLKQGPEFCFAEGEPAFPVAAAAGKGGSGQRREKAKSFFILKVVESWPNWLRYAGSRF
jgi:hypothetical protein